MLPIILRLLIAVCSLFVTSHFQPHHVLGDRTGCVLEEALHQEVSATESGFGLTNGIAYVGHMFEYWIPKDAVGENCEIVKIAETGSDALPAWTTFNSSFSKLTGVPLDGDVGETYIKVSALCKHKSSGECVVYTDVFQIRVYSSKKKRRSGEHRASSSETDTSKDTACSEGVGGTYVNLVLDGSLDNLTVSQRIGIISTISNFVQISVYKIYLRKFRATNEVLGAGGKHVVAAGPGNTDSERDDFIEVSWNVACGPFKELKNLVRIIQHNVEGGRFSSELGYGMLGWYITSFSSSPSLETRSKRRAIRATVMPTPVLTQAPPTKIPTAYETTIMLEKDSSVTKMRHSKLATSYYVSPVPHTSDKTHDDKFYRTSHTSFTYSDTSSPTLHIFSSSSFETETFSSSTVESSTSIMFKSSDILSLSGLTTDAAYTPLLQMPSSSSIHKQYPETEHDSSSDSQHVRESPPVIQTTPFYFHTEEHRKSTHTVSHVLTKHLPEQTSKTIETISPTQTTHVLIPKPSLWLPDDKSLETETELSGSGHGEIEDDEDFVESMKSKSLEHQTTFYHSYPGAHISGESDIDSVTATIASIHQVYHTDSRPEERDSATKTFVDDVPSQSSEYIPPLITPSEKTQFSSDVFKSIAASSTGDQSGIVITTSVPVSETKLETHPVKSDTKDIYTSEILTYEVRPTPVKSVELTGDTDLLHTARATLSSIILSEPDLMEGSGSGSGSGEYSQENDDDDDFVFVDISSSADVLYPSELASTRVHHTEYETFQLPQVTQVVSRIFEDTHEVYFQESPSFILKSSILSQVLRDSSFIFGLSTSAMAESTSRYPIPDPFGESSDKDRYVTAVSLTLTKTEYPSQFSTPSLFDEFLNEDITARESIQSTSSGTDSLWTPQISTHTSTSKTLIYSSDLLESDYDYMGSGSGSGSGSGAGADNKDNNEPEFFFDDSSIYSNLQTSKLVIHSYTAVYSSDVTTQEFVFESSNDILGIFRTVDLPSTSSSDTVYLIPTPSVPRISVSSVPMIKVEKTFSVVSLSSVTLATDALPIVPSSEVHTQPLATESHSDTTMDTIHFVSSTIVFDGSETPWVVPFTPPDDNVIRYTEGTREYTPSKTTEHPEVKITDQVESTESTTTQQRTTGETPENTTPMIIPDTALLVQNFGFVVLSPTEVELSWKPPEKEGLHSFVLTYQREKNKPNEREFIRIPAYRKLFHVVNLDADTGYYFNISAEFDDGTISHPVHLHAITPPGEIKNFAPRPVNKIGELTARVGEKFEYRLPDNTFQDEDGNINDLRISVRLPHKPHIPRDFWLQFNTRTKTLYGLPLQLDVKGEPYEFLITASDSKGETTIDSFKINLNASRSEDKLAPQTHRFYLTLSGNYRKFTSSRKNAILLIGRISSYFGDRDPRYMTIVDIRRGSVILIWTNHTLSGNKCRNESISKLYNKLINSEGEPKEEFSDHLGSQYKVQSVKLKTLGPCSSAPFVPQSSTDFDIWAAIVLPAIIAVVVLLLIIIIMLVIYWNCARNRRRPDTPTEFKRRTKPVILPDEIDYEDPSLRPQRPLILPSDESNGTSNDGQESTPNGVPSPQYPSNGYNAFGNRNGVNNGRGPKPPAYRPPRELPPAYRLPPPYTPNQGSSEV